MRDRLNNHFRINTRLSMMSDKQLTLLLSKAKLTKGCGQNATIEIEGQRIFVKKVPLTSLEMANAFSTKNLYKIPTWYNYGVGSAGFGAFRELAAHVKTTNWVLNNQATGFPLLHHHRILTTEKSKESMPDLKGYVDYWNGSKSIEQYMLDRVESRQHLYLFLECFIPVSDWLAENPAKLNRMIPGALKTIDFLAQNSMIHFDAHMYNWLTDGKTLFLTDFGLVLDQDFELTKSEQLFFKAHRDYDFAQVIEGFGYALVNIYLDLNPDKVDLVEYELEQTSTPDTPYMNSMINVLLALHANRQIKLPAYVTQYLRKYQPVINAKNLFFKDLRTGKKSADKYPAARMRKLLKQLEIIK